MSVSGRVVGRGSRRGRVVGSGFAVLLLGVVGAACKPAPAKLPRPENAALTARYLDPVFPNITTTTNIEYSTADDLEGNPVDLHLDMYQPTGDTATARPAIVVVHGGGFYIGNKTFGKTVPTAQYYAHLGYVVVSIDYRLLAKVNCGNLGGLISDASGCRTAALAAASDGQAAVRWLRANAATYGIDTNRIAMTGYSAGAIISIEAGIGADYPNMDLTDPRLVTMLGGAVFPPNETDLDESSQIQGWASISGSIPPTDTPTLTANLDALATPPTPGIMFNGTADDEVPYSWAPTTAAAIGAAPADGGTLVILSTYDGLGHVSSLWSNVKDQLLTQGSRFMYYEMDLGNAPQNFPTP